MSGPFTEDVRGEPSSERPGGRAVPSIRPATPQSVIPRPGTVLTIQEDDYRYGQGELVLRVTAVGSVYHLADGDWLMVAGVQVGWNGADFGDREVLVRWSSLIPKRGRP